MIERNVPLVSVIIPTYNSARTLSMALRSIKRRTYPSIEIIIV
jgi:glycosyltransferase involved in cell wall biosynthesis